MLYIILVTLLSNVLFYPLHSNYAVIRCFHVLVDCNAAYAVGGDMSGARILYVRDAADDVCLYV